MALLGGKKYVRDLAQAKSTFIARARRHASDIAPGINIECVFEPIALGWEAQSFYYPDRNSMLFIVDDLWFEANMYNIDSEMFDGLHVHELCHLKLDIIDYQAGLISIDDLIENPTGHHGTKRYLNCVGKYVPTRFARALSSPGYTWFRNYLGSKDGNVPVDIFFIYEVYCPVCKENHYMNLLMFLDETRPHLLYESAERKFIDYIYHPNELLHMLDCDECGGPIERIKHLTPLEVYAEDKSTRGNLTRDLMLFA